MAFKEYGNYDAVGLAELARTKQVTARELLDEAIVRTAKVDPQINAVVVKHYDYAERQIERGTAARWVATRGRGLREASGALDLGTIRPGFI